MKDDGIPMGTQSQGHRWIAETLIAVPRYLSREKIRLLGVDGVAAVVPSIAADPDEYTKSLRDEPRGLSCTVCGKVKYQGYFGRDKSPENEPYRVCRYCRWRIKSRADEQYRNRKTYPNASFVCDWVISRGDDLLFIEYFGLSGRADYDEKIVQKRAALVQAGVELIELYYEDLLRLEERLGGLVSTSDGLRTRKSPPES